MHEFRVGLTETVTYTVTVTAPTADLAAEDAREIWACSDDPFDEFEGNSSGVEVQFSEAVVPVDVDEPTLEEWQAEVAAGDTVRGFEDWKAVQIELRAHD